MNVSGSLDDTYTGSEDDRTVDGKECFSGQISEDVWLASMNSISILNPQCGLVCDHYINAVDLCNRVRQNCRMSQTSTQARRGRPPKGASQLSRSLIVAATLTVIDHDGVNAVSMRTVARALGVDPKSLYNHVDGKDGLLDAVTEHLLGSITIPSPVGDTADDLRAVATAFRAATLRHPAAAPLVLTRQLSSFDALAPVQALLVILKNAGCEPGEAVHLLRMLVATMIGTLLREVNAGPTYGTTDIAGIANREAALRQSGLSAVSEAAAELARFDCEMEYEYAIDRSIDVVLRRTNTLDQAGTAFRSSASSNGTKK